MPPQFGKFSASELYCPKCRKSQPVRERLLLVLPSGELYDYLCSVCATSLGSRTVSGPALMTAAAPPSRSTVPRKRASTGRAVGQRQSLPPFRSLLDAGH